MGNAQSPAGDPRFTSATRAFSEKELDDLKSLFDSLAAQSQSGGKYISPSAFKAYTGINGPLGDRLYDIVTQNRKDQKLTLEDLVIAKGTYEKGTKEEIDEFLYQLCDVDGDGNLTRSDLEAVISEILDNVSSSGNSEPSSAPEQRPIGIFLDAANFTKDNEGSSGRSMSFEDFRSWCRLVPSARKFLISLLKPSSQGSQVPHLIHQDDIDSNMLLLKEYAWHIGGALSHQELGEWKLLYHSALHGQSFNTFLGNMSWVAYFPPIHFLYCGNGPSQYFYAMSLGFLLLVTYVHAAYHFSMLDFIVGVPLWCACLSCSLVPMWHGAFLIPLICL